MGLGYLCTWRADSLTLVWAMIILVAVGTGLFKGNLSGINGLLFHDADELDAAFSIQYSFVNIGSFTGPHLLRYSLQQDCSGSRQVSILYF